MTKRMKKWLMRVLIPTFFVAVLLLSMTGIATAATGPQNWRLDSQSHPDSDPAGAGCQVMWRGPTPAVSGVTPISKNNGSVIWCANEAAAVNVTFPGATDGNPWYVQLRVDSDWARHTSTCLVDVGSWNAVVGFQPFDVDALITMRVTAVDILEVKVQYDPVQVAQGDYLALKVTNASTTTDHEVVSSSQGCQGCSWVESPCSDPGYPVPEMATGLLFGAGIVGLVGYAYVRHQRRKALL